MNPKRPNTTEDVTVEHRIYDEELRWADIHHVAEEFGTKAAYVSRAIHGDDSPARRYIRWIRALRAVRPKAAARLHEWVLGQVREQADIAEPVENWNHDEEVRALYSEVSEGFECALRGAGPRELRRELLSDIRQKLDRWERRLDAVEAPKLREATKR